ncbi:uncharacterized protein Z520_00357 [Fonsecaea multimorphosa CBS 102226]|uniref:Uncharacterized protein n=1 Tax=Fonsecaea multimorphosa CBS 102226 TaxID=1442371 RepID=A0A0D2HPA7_9EURO|nr:uncharacterized protein Z520_00357 [Fonsecaea multimorphosa CBS 102226]KIY03666.1 hypothetical protein Z520_00357 [Fonsecaea multimorphosa CBS 102226]
MLVAIDDTSNKLQGDIAAVIQRLDRIQLQDSTCETLFKNFQASHADALSRLSLGLETIMLEHEAIRTTSNRHRTEVAQKRICMSLSFRDMDTRQIQIREAHEDTYHWILTPRGMTDNDLGDFHAWLDSPAPDHGIFWISGKPGSGKSTLMLYLDRNLKPACCPNWLSGYGLFVCRFFLWNPGRGLQKSFQGLLQALLYQLLSSHPWLIEAVVNEERWLTACTMESESRWSIPELKMAIEACLHRISATRKIFVLVDGLDELEGTNDDRHDMLGFLRNLTRFDFLKMCLSSRPWNIFSDYFHKLPQLQLQLFTKFDIEKYVRHSLSHSMRVQTSYLHNSGEGEKLIEAIVEKASGVFLWVRLVVQELLRGFQDGETIRTLKRKVDSMPADLDGFFKRIIHSIDPAYRSEGSAFLQTAVFSLQNTDVEWPRGLLEFTFLEADDADFATRPSYDFNELDCVDMDALEYRIDLGKRRLNSRCMGLLEWAHTSVVEKFTTVPPSSERLGHLLSTQVNFLHRSLMDFLLTTDAQSILRQCTNGPFQARRFLCSAILTKVCAISARCLAQSSYERDDFLVWLVGEDTDCLLRAVACSEDMDEPTVNVIMNRLYPALELLRHSQAPFWGVNGTPRLMKLLKQIKSGEDLSIKVGIEYNITKFVKAHLRPSMTGGIRGQDLLRNALHPLSSEEPYPQMVKAVLQAGADPDIPEPVWCKYLSTLPLQRQDVGKGPVSSTNVEVMGIMIEHNAAASHRTKMMPVKWRHLLGKDDAFGVVALTDMLDILDLTEPDRQRLKAILRQREEANTLYVCNAAGEHAHVLRDFKTEYSPSLEPVSPRDFAPLLDDDTWDVGEEDGESEVMSWKQTWYRDLGPPSDPKRSVPSKRKQSSSPSPESNTRRRIHIDLTASP